MKKLLLTNCLLLFYICSSAQTERGSFKIDGYAGFSRTEEEREYTSMYYGSTESTFTSLYFAPSVSYFVIKGLAVGASVALQRTATKYGEPTPYDEEFVSRSTTLGPTVYYYVPLSKSFFLVPAASIRWGRTVSNGFTWIGGDVVDEYETKGRTRAIDASVGLAYFLNRHVSLDFGINYGHTKTEYESDLGANESVTRGTISAALGLSIFLTRNGNDE